MIIYYTTIEGGKWHKGNWSRKSLNKILKTNCKSWFVVQHGIKAIMLRNQIYDFKLFKYTHSYYRKTYYKELSCQI